MTSTTCAYGVDGCKKGWFFAGLGDGAPRFGVVPKLKTLLDLTGDDSPVLVDCPIGLLESGNRERLCDLEARKALSPKRTSSVFPVPSRPAVYAESFEEAQRWNKKALGKSLTKQTWCIVAKIREIDELLHRYPRFRSRVREVHPEVCFWALAGRPMEHPKRKKEGVKERVNVLKRWVAGVEALMESALKEHRGYGVTRADILDALVAALCAVHIGESATLPEDPEKDARGLPMEMVYWKPAKAG